MTAATAVRTETAVTVDAERLRTGIDISRLFASGDDTNLPQILSIALRVDGDRLLMYATDRYTISRFTMPCSGGWGAPLLLRPAQFRALHLFLGEAQKGEPVKLTRDGVRVLAETTHMTTALPGWPAVDPFAEEWLSSVSVGQIEEWYAATPGPVEKIGLNPSLVARYAKVSKLLRQGYETSTWTFVAPNKPVRVDIGPDFAGLVMPIRLYSSDVTS